MMICVEYLIIIAIVFVGCYTERSGVSRIKRYEFAIPIRIPHAVADYYRRLIINCQWTGGDEPPVTDIFWVLVNRRMLAGKAVEVTYEVPRIGGLIWDVCAKSVFNDDSSLEDPQCRNPSKYDCQTNCKYNQDHNVFEDCPASSMCFNSHWTTTVDTHKDPLTLCETNMLTFRANYSDYREFYGSKVEEVGDMKIEKITIDFNVALAGPNNGLSNQNYNSNNGYDEFEIVTITREGTTAATVLNKGASFSTEDGFPKSHVMLQTLDKDKFGKVLGIAIHDDSAKDPLHHEIYSYTIQGDYIDIFLEGTRISASEGVRRGSFEIRVKTKSSESGEEYWIPLTFPYAYSYTTQSRSFDERSRLYLCPEEMLGTCGSFHDSTPMTPGVKYYVIESFSTCERSSWEGVSETPQFLYVLEDGSTVSSVRGVYTKDMSSSSFYQQIDPELRCSSNVCFLYLVQLTTEFFSDPGVGKRVIGYRWVGKSTIRYIGTGRRDLVEPHEEIPTEEKHMDIEAVMIKSSYFGYDWTWVWILGGLGALCVIACCICLFCVGCPCSIASCVVMFCGACGGGCCVHKGYTEISGEKGDEEMNLYVRKVEF